MIPLSAITSVQDNWQREVRTISLKNPDHSHDPHSHPAAGRASPYTIPIVVTVLITVLVTIAINLIVFFIWYRCSALRDIFSSREGSSSLWALLCSCRRPRRVRPRNRMTSWCINDNETLTGSPFDSFRDHGSLHHSSDHLRSYSRVCNRQRPHGPVRVMWWKILDRLQVLNPFKRRPVAVKSAKPKCSFLIVEGGGSQLPSHLDTANHHHHQRLASVATVDDPPDASGQSAGLSTGSSSPFPSTSSWKTTWNGPWKNPFKSNSPSAISLFPPSSSRIGDAQPSPAASARAMGDDLAEHHNPPSFGQGQDRPTSPVGPQAPEREDSVILVSRVPGVDFSDSSCTTINTIAVIPPSESLHTYPYMHNRRSPSPTASLSSLELSPSSRPTSPEDPLHSRAPHHRHHHHKRSIVGTPPYDRFAGSPVTENPALPAPDPFLLSHDASRAKTLRPPSADPTLPFPVPVRAAGYMGVSDRYYNHNRNNLSTGNLTRSS